MSKSIVFEKSQEPETFPLNFEILTPGMFYETSAGQFVICAYNNSNDKICVNLDNGISGYLPNTSTRFRKLYNGHLKISV